MLDVKRPTIQQLRTSSKFVRVLALIISYVFHPVFMPMVMTLVIYKLAPVSFASVAPRDFTQWLGIIGINTIFFPLVFVFLLRKLDFISSWHMKDPKERIVPLIAIMTFYFWAYLIFKNKAYAFILQVLLLGSFWGTISLFMINIFYRISMHTVAVGGMIGLMIVLMIISPVNMAIPFFVSLAIAGVVGTARLILDAHKPSEIWWGYIVGCVAMVAAYYYLI